MSEITIRTIRTEADYGWALAEIAQDVEAEPSSGSAEADRFDVLADLIAKYEARHWPIEPADPFDAVRYRMEIGDLGKADLARLIGSRSRPSEILRRRPLTMGMAYKLHKEWHIPAEALLAPYHTDAEADEDA